ncbi:unnamed protein product [Adineta ricciae]|uniref:Uncharacterized protein n=1 Tax=Adineta ricciae TaxID=249248 RepID=A0A815VA67_ADIRI|nr:unnamed protein product [Adineta ricciae]CAF1569480.1 unnamed protein product [Adineta ricciae]
MIVDCKQQQQTEQQMDAFSVNDNQNLRESGTNLALIDFLQCYVRIQPCKIEDYGISYSEAIGATFQTYKPLPEQTTKSTQQLQDNDQSNQCITLTAAESNEEHRLFKMTECEKFLANSQTPITSVSNVPSPRTSTPIPQDPSETHRNRKVTFKLPELEQESDSESANPLPDISSLSKHLTKMTVTHESEQNQSK